MYNRKMKYLVVRPHNNGLCILTIKSDEDMLDLPFESWALSDGNKILFVNNKMHSLLKNYYMAGSFFDKAIYTYSYEDMCNIIRAKLGPSDHDRYQLALASAPQADQTIDHRKAELVAHSAWLGIRLFFGTLWKIGWFAVTLIIIPILVGVIGKHKR